MTTKLSKAQKLALAGAVAPTLRGEAPKRKIKVYDRETGEVKREIDDVELRKKVLEAQEIEFSTELVCAGANGLRCPSRRPVPSWANEPRRVAARGGRPWVCKSCLFRPPVDDWKRCRNCGVELSRNTRSAAVRRGTRAQCQSCRESVYRSGRPSVCAHCGAEFIVNKSKNKLCSRACAYAARKRVRRCQVCQREIARATVVGQRASGLRDCRTKTCSAGCEAKLKSQVQVEVRKRPGFAEAASARDELRRTIPRQSTCGAVGCSKTPPKFAFKSANVKSRNGRPWMCAEHSKELHRQSRADRLRANQAMMTAEALKKRVENMRRVGLANRRKPAT